VFDGETCHVCDEPLGAGEGSRGALLFLRGDDVVVEEPRVCDRCSIAIGMTAMWRMAAEDDGG